MAQSGEKEDIHGHSGWLIPAAFFFAVMLLSGLILGWYLRPGPNISVAPTIQSNLVTLSVRGIRLEVPANYIQNAAARAGGARESLALAALYPGWQGYSQELARQFQGNAPDSAVVRVLLHGDDNVMDSATRLARIYRPYLVARQGAKGPFGLTQYGFADNSGYETSELFAGDTPSGPVLFLCERPAPDLPSANCQATDRPLGKSVSYSFRFKRAWLARWRELSTGVDGMIARFRKN